jgi:Conserved TM helix
MDAISYGIFSEVDHWLRVFPLAQAAPVQSATNAATGFVQNAGSQFGRFVPSFLGALVILIVGWVVATIAASLIQSLLKKTGIDSRISGMTSQRRGEAPLPIGKWVATAVYWLILAFTLVAFLNALQLEAVSAPLNGFLDQILIYLPRLGSAAVLLGVAWVIATLARTIVVRGLARFNLDNKLAEQTADGSGSPIVLTETLGNALYWFVFLFFLPLVLDVLQLQGPLAPVQNLLDQILSALPKILTAVIIAAVGWLVARIVKGVVTNLLAAVGTDQIGSRMGFRRQVTGGMSLSSLLGTVVYVLVLIPTAIAALNALEIAAISAPAVAMLNEVMTKLPQILTAGLIVALFYFIGRFVSDLVTNILTSIGFNRITSVLGIPDLPTTDRNPFDEPVVNDPMGINEPRAINGQATEAVLTSRTPSEIAGIVTLIGIVLFGIVTATEVLGLPALTAMMNSILAVSARVLVGVAIFAVGLYLANLAFNLIAMSGGRQSRLLAQTARICILAFVAAMALQQMGIASSIVNLAFGLLLGAVAVAIALAFGLGGRDVAGEKIRGFLNDFEAGKSEDRSANGELTGSGRR